MGSALSTDVTARGDPRSHQTKAQGHPTVPPLAAGAARLGVAPAEHLALRPVQDGAQSVSAGLSHSDSAGTADAPRGRQGRFEVSLPAPALGDPNPTVVSEHQQGRALSLDREGKE